MIKNVRVSHFHLNGFQFAKPVIWESYMHTNLVYTNTEVSVSNQQTCMHFLIHRCCKEHSKLGGTGIDHQKIAHKLQFLCSAVDRECIWFSNLHLNCSLSTWNFFNFCVQINQLNKKKQWQRLIEWKSAFGLFMHLYVYISVNFLTSWLIVIEKLLNWSGFMVRYKWWRQKTIYMYII